MSTACTSGPSGQHAPSRARIARVRVLSSAPSTASIVAQRGNGKHCTPKEERTCNNFECPQDCKVEPFNPWTTCTKSWAAVQSHARAPPLSPRSVATPARTARRRVVATRSRAQRTAGGKASGTHGRRARSRAAMAMALSSQQRSRIFVLPKFGGKTCTPQGDAPLQHTPMPGRLQDCQQLERVVDLHEVLRHWHTVPPEEHDAAAELRRCLPRSSTPPFRDARVQPATLPGRLRSRARATVASAALTQQDCILPCGSMLRRWRHLLKARTRNGSDQERAPIRWQALQQPKGAGDCGRAYCVRVQRRQPHCPIDCVFDAEAMDPVLEIKLHVQLAVASTRDIVVHVYQHGGASRCERQDRTCNEHALPALCQGPTPPPTPETSELAARRGVNS